MDHIIEIGIVKPATLIRNGVKLLIQDKARYEYERISNQSVPFLMRLRVLKSMQKYGSMLFLLLVLT